MMNNHLVSIIIPTYNRANLISETLDSILSQTYINWECIIVDDGSIDDTKEILQKHLFLDNRFQYHLRPDNKPKGANTCRNYGFELSKGKYIKWFDSDDLMHPEFLEKQVDILEKKHELDFCASFSKIFSNNIDDNLGFYIPNVIIDNDAIYNFIIGRLYFLTPSSLWRKSLLIGKKMFDEDLYNAHETDFNFRRLVEGASFYYLKDVLFYVRRGHQSIDSDSINNIKSSQSQFDYFQKVYNFLIINDFVLDNLKINDLKKYIIYRQLHLFYNLRIKLKYNKNIKNYKSLFSNLLKVKLNNLDFFRIFFGILIVLFFKQGYNLINVKSYDIRSKNS